MRYSGFSSCRIDLSHVRCSERRAGNRMGIDKTMERCNGHIP